MPQLPPTAHRLADEAARYGSLVLLLGVGGVGGVKLVGGQIVGGHIDVPYMPSGVPTAARSASLSRASVTVRADGVAIFQLRYVRGATWTPCSDSKRQIDSTRKPRPRIWSMNPQISGGAGRAPARRKSRPLSESRWPP
jgi:hypothetical protein